MPMSARVRTGASLMPSPTNASLPFVLLAASSVGLYDIGNDDVARVLPVDRHMDDRADAVAVLIRNAELRHELSVSGGDAVPVDRGGDAVAAQLLNVRDAAAVDLAAVGGL